jgi:glycosyltransferase involved in cell wall biosynthesis
VQYDSRRQVPSFRVLQVTPCYVPSTAYGGPPKSAYELAGALANLGQSIQVVTTNADGRRKVLGIRGNQVLGPNLRAYYAPRILLHSVSPQLVSQLSRKARWADVIHLHAVYSFPTIPTLFVARRLRIPVVWTLHGALHAGTSWSRPRPKAAWRLLCRAVRPAVMVLHATSEAEAGSSKGLLGNVPIVVVPHGVAVPADPPPPPGGDELKLLFVGRLHPIKGLDRLLRGLRLVAGEMRFHLRLAGGADPQHQALLESLVRELGLQERVTFTGLLAADDLAREYVGADVVVLPSHRENFGLVVAEALANARPVIVSRGTPWSQVEQVGCGFWISNEPEEIARAIRELRVSALAEMGRRGWTWMRHDFSWERVATTMVNVYADLVRGREHLAGQTRWDEGRNTRDQC